MFHDLNTLTGSSVIATDGEMGSIRNFLFDDQSWTIRYLVALLSNLAGYITVGPGWAVRLPVGG